MSKKILISILISLILSTMQGQTNSINKMWIVYNSVDTSLTGWHSFMDSYILDFTDSKNLKIKTLSEKQIVNVPYFFNTENGIIYEENGEILYAVQKLSSNILILKMDENSSTTVCLIPVIDNNNVKDINVRDTLKKNTWLKDSDEISFTDEPYKVAGQIYTPFSVFIKYDLKTSKEYRGAWLLDSYEGLYFLELYSEEGNNKSIYQIEYLSKNQLKAVSNDKNGNKLVMELFSK